MTLVDIKDSLDPLRDCIGIQAKEVWWSYVKAYRILPNQTSEKEREEIILDTDKCEAEAREAWSKSQNRNHRCMSPFAFEACPICSPKKERIPTFLEYYVASANRSGIANSISEYLDKYMMEKG